MSKKTIFFEKYEGTGNDFIIINGENHKHINFTNDIVNHLCNRHLGIGADGFIIINKSEDTHFEMIYYNSDGNIGSMCGNGGRSAVTFALLNNIVNNKEIKFRASDGIHNAIIEKSEINKALIKLAMKNAIYPTYPIKDTYFIDTGSPHLIIFVEDTKNIDVYNKGKELRFSKELQPEGANINFVSEYKDGIFVRTYERGVENETLSCGTGVTASAIIYCITKNQKNNHSTKIYTKGGELNVLCNIKEQQIPNIHLIGYAKRIFSGSIDI